MSDQITIVIPEDATMQILDTLLKSTKTVNGSSAYEVLDLIRSWRQDIVATAPAVSEDQPKPRMWSFGDPEPEDCDVVRDCQNDVWTRRVIQGEELWTSPDTTYATWRHITLKWSPLSEVLADSEQVRHG